MCSRMTNSGISLEARRRAGRSRQGAGILLLRGLDQLEGLLRARHGLDQLEDVPLVPGVLLVLDLDHVHLLQQLVVPLAERARAALQDVEAGALLEIGHPLRALRAPGDRKSTRLNYHHTDIYTLSLHDALPI